MLLVGRSHAASMHLLHFQKPEISPSKDHALSLPFSPLLSASPSALPSYQDAALPDDCPFPVWRHSLPSLCPLQLQSGQQFI